MLYNNFINISGKLLIILTAIGSAIATTDKPDFYRSSDNGKQKTTFRNYVRVEKPIKDYGCNRLPSVERVCLPRTYVFFDSTYSKMMSYQIILGNQHKMKKNYTAFESVRPQTECGSSFHPRSMRKNHDKYKKHDGK